MSRFQTLGQELIPPMSIAYSAHFSRRRRVGWEWDFPSATPLSRATRVGFGRRLEARAARLFISNCQPKRLARRKRRRGWSRTRKPRLRPRGPLWVKRCRQGFRAENRSMSASLIGRLGSSAFRLSTRTMSMSLTGSCFSSESAPRPFHHGDSKTRRNNLRHGLTV